LTPIHLILVKQDKMSQENSHINEFLADPEFVRWVRNPDKELEVYWLNWMDAHPEKRESLKLAREIIQGFQFKAKLPERSVKQDVLANILNGNSKHIDLFNEETFSSKREPFRPLFWNRTGQMSKVAAILLIGFVFSFGINYLYNDPPQPAPVALVTTVKKATSHGEKLNVKLPDGTLVWLNAGSELQYPERFDSLERMVYLKGEAFFEVEKADNWPFSVVSGNLTTTALGTSFNIKNERDGILSISLVTGQVKVENGLTHENVLLIPGQQLKYAQEAKKTGIGSFDIDRVIGWRSGILQFNQATFEEVREELEKWYGVKIKVSGRPHRKWQLSGTYENQNLEMVLQRISYVQQLNFTIHGKNVHLKF